MFPSSNNRRFVLLLNDKTPEPYCEFMRLRVVDLNTAENRFDQVQEIQVNPPSGCYCIKGYEICSRAEGGYMVAGTAGVSASRGLDMFIFAFDASLQPQLFRDYAMHTGPYEIAPELGEMGGAISDDGHFIAGGVRFRYQETNHTDFYLVFEPNRGATDTRETGPELLPIECGLDQGEAVSFSVERIGSDYRFILEGSSSNDVHLRVYDISGREVRYLGESWTDGERTVFDFNGCDQGNRPLPVGIYVAAPENHSAAGVTFAIIN